MTRSARVPPPSRSSTTHQLLNKFFFMKGVGVHVDYELCNL